MVSDWIDEDLMTGPTPKGQKRNWNCRNYRRALQIIRLKHQGLNRYSDVRVHLYINGAENIPFDLLQQSVLSEYARVRKDILRSITTVYDVGLDKNLSARHEATLVRQMGQASPKILPAGFEYTAKQLVDAFEALRFGKTNDSLETSLREIFKGFGLPDGVIEQLNEFFEMISLTLIGLSGPPDEIANSAEDSIRNTGAELFENAKTFFVQVRNGFHRFPEILSILGVPHENIAQLKNPVEEIVKVIRSNPWQLGVYVMFLHYADKKGDQGKSLVQMAQDFESLKEIFDKSSQINMTHDQPS